jgi:hypothetical protein
MRTKLTIMAIVVAALLAAIGVLITLMVTMGPWVGLGTGAAIALIVLAIYRFVVRPWHSRWGATDKEVQRSMPGDELVPGAASTTRATTIDATPEEVWPWLVQIGYGRAGWYSYDWIDNDGKPSADHVIAEFQDLHVGDQILMTPDLGPEVKAIESGRWIVSGSESDSWCLALYPTGGDGRTRLLSRWRARWPRSPATVFWIAISDPGAFVMERKMLKGIKRRVEATM